MDHAPAQDAPTTEGPTAQCDHVNELPVPSRPRWQPCRSGILNLYRFDEQEFWYEQGRLLLRGNNGTGKSRVLALQLPFLLDGEVAPHRFEPDRDPAKRMEWNLLLGKFKDRRGYTWVEFGRGDANGPPRFITLGCGLQAVDGRGITGRWFFVTSQRVGQDLLLQSSNRQPLTRDQLADRLGTNGKIFTTAQDFRREVDAALFTLGEQRYESLVELLITLRQPQLARTLDEEALSRALSEALPPLGQKILDDVAESMRGLEADREQLESHRAADEAIQAFLSTYGRYAGVASRRKAEVVRQTHFRFEETGRQLKAAEAELQVATGNSAAIEKALEDLKAQETETESAQATLLASPQMAAARELESAKRDTNERRADAAQAQSDAEQAAALLTRSQQAFESARQGAADARETTRLVLARAAEHAAAVGLQSAHKKALGEIDLASPTSERFVEGARAAVSKAIESRRDEVRLLRETCRAADKAADALTQVKRDRDRAAAAADAAEAEARAATALVHSSVEETVSAYRKWYDGLVELRPISASELADLLRSWALSGSGESPLSDTVRTAVVAAAERFSRMDRDLDAHVKAAQAEECDLTDQRDALLAGRHETPLPPHTRDVEGRTGRRGAPFWALCEFEPSVADADRAGLEAALEASGLLDAWVLPSGAVLDAKTLDCFLTLADEPELSVHTSLRAVLRPNIDKADPLSVTVDEQIVTSLLRAIGLGRSSSRVYVAGDGSWRNGPLTGFWTKPIAEHLGATARELGRQRRLASLEEQLRLVQQALRDLNSERAKLAQGRQAAHAEQGASPRDDSIRDALAAEAHARRAAAGDRERLTEAETATQRAHDLLGAAVTQLDQTAHDLGLEGWLVRLDDLDQAVSRYWEASIETWSSLRQHASTLTTAAAEETRLQEAELDAGARRARARQAKLRAQAAQARYATLEQTQGAAAKDVVARLEEVKKQLAGIRAHKDGAVERKTQAAAESARLDERIGDLRSQREEHERVRDDAVETYRRFVATGLMGIAVAGRHSLDVQDWSTTRLIELARQSEQDLLEMVADDASWERRQKELFDQFKQLEDTLLPHDHRPEMRPEADVFVVRAVFQGRSCSIDQLHSALQDEVAQRQTLLDAREREILENHLIGEVAQHLHDRLRQAEQHVRDMNAELARVPTSSGMVLRFRWEPRDDGPAGLPDARRRLLGAVGTWSPQEREAVGRFLQERIKAERVANDTGSWQEQLTTALDYRAWHDFVIERNIDGNWRRLTRRTHGTASGGEKAIALMIPMFAAAASHYRSAAPTAPRLILLDEAFVGVDTEMRAKCMALLRAFDLDFIMTSDREWCCYATMPGVAICQLSARPGVDGVYVSRWVWNGREKVYAPSNDGNQLKAPASAADGTQPGGPTP